MATSVISTPASAAEETHPLTQSRSEQFNWVFFVVIAAFHIGTDQGRSEYARIDGMEALDRIAYCSSITVQCNGRFHWNLSSKVRSKLFDMYF